MAAEVSVIMPVFNGAGFIERAIESLLAQTFKLWELIIVDDGSTDNTHELVSAYLEDKRIRTVPFSENRGLGAALNRGIEQTASPLIAYLPCDDVYYAGHLEGLIAALREAPGAIAAYSGVRHHYNRSAKGQIEGYSLQLVQVAHRRTGCPWVERDELTTDDLERMLWGKLRGEGSFVTTGSITCEWVDHPNQRHKIVREPEGGIQQYKQTYSVKEPLIFHSTTGNYIDEVSHFRRFRDRPPTTPSPAGLKILLVGELAYNAERVLALEERGHSLYGLWMKRPYWYNTVGPLPFGHVQDIPADDWVRRVEELKPDIIYALLNWQAVPFAYEVLQNNPGVPFVWHFKEGPFICLEKGTWKELVELYCRADGRIYSSPEMQQWFELMMPNRLDRATSFVLDGDLPKAEWFSRVRSRKLSVDDGEIHTVVPGRPIGLHPHDVEALGREKIHLHFYGDFTHGQWKRWIEDSRAKAPGHLHLHPQVHQDRWVEEFSQYDAGWLHVFKSENCGELQRATWDDLNYPARIATLAAAGLPLLQGRNDGSIVATQTLARDLGIGVFFGSAQELGEQLRSTALLARVQQNVWEKRLLFSFDYHADRLIDFFRLVIRGGRKRTLPARSKGGYRRLDGAGWQKTTETETLYSAGTDASVEGGGPSPAEVFAHD